MIFSIILGKLGGGKFKIWVDKTTREEVSDLLAIVARDITDTEHGISLDWRFGIAYNAALKLCTILLYATGYRPSHDLQHYRTIAALPLILSPDRRADSDYLDECRKKRNVVEYRYVGGASESDVKELISFVKQFREEVIGWLKMNHPDLLEKVKINNQ